MIIRSIPKFFPVAKVAAMAVEMTAADDGWTYTPIYDPSGRSEWARIEIRDEEGEFVAYA